MGLDDPIDGPRWILDPFGGPYAMDPYAMDPYAMDPYYEEAYFFDDPSLYDDYITELEASGVSAEGLQATDQIFSGTNNADSVNKSTSAESWTLSGYSGADSLTGSPQNDVIWGALGNDTLTGLGGSDQFYYTDLLEGKDQITDFTVGQDTLLFAHNPVSAYSRSGLYTDGASAGGTFDVSTQGNSIPTIFIFSNSTFYGVSSSADLANRATGFSLENSGNAIAGEQAFMLTPATAGGGVDVFIWTDGANIDPAQHGSGNIAMDGNFDTDELAYIAELGSSTDINTITSASFAFQTISGFFCLVKKNNLCIM